MRLMRLIYVSKVSATLAKNDIENILLVARQKNEAIGVTGILFFNSKYFLQCLEGTREDVNATYNKIVQDSRNSHSVVLDYREIITREFSDWSMGYAAEYKLTAPVILRHSASSELNPYEMSGEGACSLLLSLKEVTG